MTRFATRSAATAAADRVLTRDGYLDRWSAAHGVDARASWWVSGWLSLTYAAARPLAVRRVPPDAVTVGGVLLASGALGLAALGGRWPLVAVALVVASALLDGLDGAVAVLRDVASRWGAVLDAVADRCAEVLLLAALWALGAPGWVCAVAGAMTLLHESVRAAARAAGDTGVGVVTVAERPTRVIVAAFALAGAGALPGHAPVVATVAAVIGAGLAVVGCAQLLVVTRRRLA